VPWHSLKLEDWIQRWAHRVRHLKKKPTWANQLRAGLYYDAGRGWLNICLDCGSVFHSQLQDGKCWNCSNQSFKKAVHKWFDDVMEGRVQ
jgi:hypothetical protein